ncbi:feruloyl esteras-like protein B precursor [Paraphoma chrysanthemicola]|uniref:Carboxylic ester hydrolase n=1 Tax=Paraphoma chrysanthemicola TaxID=798071 RepID=A0A8K0RJA3_9PLEO|nr:feruloyl esteras-like protein B precursor [Paraphoma chrysanthemicola]
MTNLLSKVAALSTTFFWYARPLLASSVLGCAPTTFSDLRLFGGTISHIGTTIYNNLSLVVPANQNHYAKNITKLTVCEVLITYTHPGYNDTINTLVWLPTPASWTGRFLGAGGGGWTTGADNVTLAWAASEGFAVVTTDGGHPADVAIDEWAQISPGNVNWILLQDFASTTLDEAATLGKLVVQAFYGGKPTYSYWNGCSTGGRQGHQMAQRYPDQYDGILATASAKNWGEMLMQEFWPQAVMNDLDAYPTSCELDAVRMAAIEACDALDGLRDGILAVPGECTFEPETKVGQQYNCSLTGLSTTITETAATVAKSTWKGATSPEGDFLWYGLEPGALFTADAATTCENGTCVGAPLGFTEAWIRYFLTMDSNYDVSRVNISIFDYLFHQSVNRYDSIIGTSDPDLRNFNKAGGKLITWHGLADSLIAPGTSSDYTKRVYERDPNAADYYRYFEAPGVDHCRGGNGWFPGSAMQSLIDWVENDVAPETLQAETQGEAAGRKANLCMWPKKLIYVGGDADEASSFACQ